MLITGAGHRIGRELALYFAEKGWEIAIHYNKSENEAQALAGEIETKGGKAMAIQANLRKDKELEKLIPETVERFGELTCLINNASVFKRDNLMTRSRKKWDRHLAVHMHAPVVLAREFMLQLPDMEEGNILNITDAALYRSHPIGSFLSYGLSKNGLAYLNRYLASEMAPHIRVNAIAPGATLPVPGEEEVFEAIRQRAPLKRHTTPEEICRTADFLITTPSITGQTIVLDGGMSIGAEMPDTES